MVGMIKIGRSHITTTNC